MERREKSLYLKNHKSIDIEFNNITFTVKEKGCKRQIVKGVSGKFYSGELTGIMGPSGAGKTSLLNVLTGFQTAGTNGSIKCSNGIKTKQGALQYKKQSCYILQDDNLPHLFTVLELMNMAADLKIRDLSHKTRKFLVQDILTNLGLINCTKTRCQDLSGGQKKRLSVALELINNPSIMFLDEPTTGLDISASTQCVQILKNLTRGGRTIICTIHQPSATLYDMFDQIYMMADGQCLYQGASTNTLPYLSSLGFNCPQYHNPADYFLEVANCEYGNFNDILAVAATDRKWKKTVPAIKIMEEKPISHRDNDEIYNYEERYSVHPPTEWTRFWILLNRMRIQLFRDWTISQLKLLLHALVGFFLGIFFAQAGQDASKVISNLGFIMISIVYLTYTSLMPSVLKFPSELAILKKERFNNWYKLKTYYAAFLLSDIPLQITFSLTYTFSSYFMTSQPCEWKRFTMVLCIQTLVAITASSLGIFLGTLVNPVNGTFFGAISLAVMICVAGFLIFFTHMSKAMYLLSYFSFLSFALEGSVQALYGYNRAPMPCPEEAIFCRYKSPKELLEFIGMDKPNYWVDVGYIMTTIILLRAVAFCTLRRKLSSV